MTMVVLLAALGAAPNAASRLLTEQEQLRAQLVAKCPKKAAAVAELESAPPPRRLALMLELEPCSGNSDLFLIQMGNAQLMNNKFADAGATFQRALKQSPTESAHLGLLTALSRQDPLDAAQKAQFEEGLAHFRQVGCTRDDLCAGLAYVAWHAEDTELTKSAGEKAIKLGYPGPQPYFLAGTVYAAGKTKAERTRAVELLTEAKKRGGPQKAIDDFLQRIGTP
jgi:hypothetical protein